MGIVRRSIPVEDIPEAEAAILKAVLNLDILNTKLYRNTRGRYQKDGRWISFGIGPNGASDLIGFRVVRITPEMVGARMAQFTAIEIKREGAPLEDDQRFYIEGINAAGGHAGVCRSPGEAAALLTGIESLKRRVIFA